MATTQKRLHISGLTPAITATDINVRLEGFGKVLALDGFGLLDGLGEPRKFAYVTLEATESNLSRCFNLLSGTIWKGTKLRIGEAKPDYPQCLQNERKRTIEDPQRPCKRRRLLRGMHGIMSNDMTLVNLENVDTHPGWYKTAQSHLIRLMKMRPARPLYDPSTINKAETLATKRKKSGAFDIPIRARVRTIDPRLFGSTHLRENMLDMDTVVMKPALSDVHISSLQILKSRSPEAPSVSKTVEGEYNWRMSPDSPISKDQNMNIDLESDITQEKLRELHLLSQMFGDAGSEWKEKLSIDGDAAEGDPVPNVVDVGMTDVASPQQDQELTHQISVSVPAEKVACRSLKDIFKPQKEEEGFSVVRNLVENRVDLDLEFDPAFDFGVTGTTAAPFQEIIPVNTQTSFQQQHVTLDNTLPFYFPQPDVPRAKDLFSIAKVEGWSFGRSGDSETIHDRWDKSKSALTQEWKKRSREARKSRRRRYGTVEGGEDI